jgi:hypothetical protein
VSHLKERTEKVCLNCKADLHGLYCHVCGQANTEPKESAWYLVTHFFYDITHFDGKFFTTAKDLITKPGFLSREYMQGRRTSYLNPVRMYVFTSAFFFIIFFSVFNVDRLHLNQMKLSNTDSLVNMQKIRQQGLKASSDKEDSLAINRVFRNMPDSFSVGLDSSGQAGKLHSRISFSSVHYHTTEQYDSAQKRLSSQNRDGWFKRLVNHKSIELANKYETNAAGFFRDWFNAFLHQFPKILFISLPIFALLLRLLYIRRKQFYYVDHGIFAIHLYIFYFVLMLFWFALRELRKGLDWNWISTLTLPLFLFSQYYFFRAMQKFYKQGIIKTFFKYILLNFLSLIVIIILFSLFFLFSALEI